MSKKSNKLIPQAARKLYFDIGNTAVKLCYKERGSWTEPITFKNEDVTGLMEYLSDLRHEFEYYIVSSVRPEKSRSLIEGLGNGKNVILNTRQIPEDYINYDSIETLGVDRFLAAFGAWRQQREACVIIDAGTACTMDYISANGTFEGGIILPGVSVLERGIRQFTPELPEVEREIPDQWPGKTTKECLQWGITGGFIDMICSMLERYKAFGTYTLFITGGDSGFIASHLDQEVKVDSKLIYKGMEHFVEEVMGD